MEAVEFATRRACSPWGSAKLSRVTVTEALAYLHSLQQFGFQPGLETTRRMAAAAGTPQARLRFIHVAGTNGKGSVCAMLDSVYRAAGLRTGLYTSPHLVRFGERVQVNRVPMSDEALARGVTELRDIVATLPGIEPTFFEFTTVMALRHFAAEGVDLVLWETGLGGRLDATNIVTPLASVITNIGLDHQAVLGPTVPQIASEKAGIIKADVPVLTATEDPDDVVLPCDLSADQGIVFCRRVFAHALAHVPQCGPPGQARATSQLEVRSVTRRAISRVDTVWRTP